MQKIRLGQLGGGFGAFFGDAHRRGSRICNQYELVSGVFSSDFEKSKEFAKSEGLSTDRVHANVDDFVKSEMALPKDQRVEAVSIVTPNSLHFEMAKKCLESGFHVICEKPITITVEEAEELEKIIKETGLTFALLHTYTGYPMVRHMREMIRNGELGDIQRIDAQYYQGWMNPIIQGDDLSSVWRLNPDVSGASSCMGDIGVHAFNLIEYTTGLEVTEILSDLSSVTDKVTLDLDGTVLLRFNENVKGVIRSSQVATGEENNLSIAIYGSKLGLKWSQEDPNTVHVLGDNIPTQVLKPGQPYINELGAMSHTMPPGHPEGIYIAIANIFNGAAKSIRGEKVKDGEFPTVLDGVRGMKFIHATVKSSAEGNVWKTI